jgi:hypothetical protein
MKTKETKPVSFRLPADVFDALQSKGLEKDLSAHEMAGKIVQEMAGKLVQENQQSPIQEIAVKDTVTHSMQVFLPPPSKQIFHFTLNEIRHVFFALCGERYVRSYVRSIGIGDEWNGLTRIDEDLWEVEIKPSDEHFK